MIIENRHGAVSDADAAGWGFAYTYDPTTGNLKNVIGRDGGALTYGYDGSLPTSVTWGGTIKGKVGVTYNNDFAVVTQSVNDEQTVSYQYNDDGQLKMAGDLTATFDPQNGAIQGTTIGNVTDSYGYTPFGEVKDYTASFSGVGVYSSSFTYDKLGRISTKTETVNGETHTYQYGYDKIGQLTDVWVDGSLKSHYDYDSNGNRVGGVYDDQDRMIKYGENTYQYSANGELQQKVTPTGTTKYEYDVLGNLTAVTLEYGTKIEYVIDGANRRVGKKVNGVLVQGWLYQDGLKPVAEVDGNGNIVSRFVYGTNGIVPDYVVKNGVKYRIISDHLGSPRVIIEAEIGQVVEQINYDEFGKVIADTNPGFIPFGFAGGLYDQDTKLVRFGARDCDAEIGRWTAKDPIGFSSGDINLYKYCSNEPINLLDTNGLEVYVGRTPTYIGGQFTGSYHTFVLVTNGPIGEKGISGIKFEAGPTGQFYGDLVPKYYDPTAKEVMSDPNRYDLQKVNSPCGKSEDEFERGIINSALNFRDPRLNSPTYFLYPEINTRDFRNSNSFSGSLLRTNGSNWNPNYSAPGWMLDVPLGIGGGGGW